MPNWLLKVYTDLIEFDIFFSVICSKTVLSTAGYDKISKLHLGRHFRSSGLGLRQLQEAH